MDQFKNFDWLYQAATNYGLKLLGAIIVLLIGFWIANRLSTVIEKQVSKTDLSISLRKFLSSLVNIVFKLLVVLAAMTTMGVETTAFVALLGGATIGVGMALQGSLSNLAGGLLILLFKPFKVGDVIEALGSTGEVMEISILQTILLTPDRKTIILPNGNVFNNPVVNYSKEGIRRVDVGIQMAYEADFNSVRVVLLEVLQQEPLLISDHGYTVEIAKFGESGISLAMNAYCKTEEYLDALWKLNSAAKKAMDHHGFKIPFPQRELYIKTMGNISSDISTKS
ncbi:MAG TPA: mechanosensitive ion channel domain-containing protein [Chitinophagaceae bacterium]|nr:mechanosensitive ion channel domain-containing protein [Chitinophagaceae bacterium]